MAAKKKSPGPEADRLKLAGDWKEAVATALGKKRPAGGWPKPARKPRKKSPTRARRQNQVD